MSYILIANFFRNIENCGKIKCNLRSCGPSLTWKGMKCVYLKDGVIFFFMEMYWEKVTIFDFNSNFPPCLGPWESQDLPLGSPIRFPTVMPLGLVSFILFIRALTLTVQFWIIACSEKNDQIPYFLMAEWPSCHDKTSRRKWNASSKWSWPRSQLGLQAIDTLLWCVANSSCLGKYSDGELIGRTGWEHPFPFRNPSSCFPPPSPGSRPQHLDHRDLDHSGGPNIPPPSPLFPGFLWSGRH